MSPHNGRENNLEIPIIEPNVRMILLILLLLLLDKNRICQVCRDRRVVDPALAIFGLTEVLAISLFLIFDV